jgi:hypothetical protein
MSNFRTAVDVFTVKPDPIETDKLVAKKQEHMCFSVLSDSTDSAKRAARVEFKEKYKDDLVIQSINHHSRTKLLLYCKQKVVPGAVAVGNNPLTRTLPARGR